MLSHTGIRDGDLAGMKLWSDKDFINLWEHQKEMENTCSVSSPFQRSSSLLWNVPWAKCGDWVSVMCVSALLQL